MNTKYITLVFSLLLLIFFSKCTYIKNLGHDTENTITESDSVAQNLVAQTVDSVDIENVADNTVFLNDSLIIIWDTVVSGLDTNIVQKSYIFGSNDTIVLKTYDIADESKPWITRDSVVIEEDIPRVIQISADAVEAEVKYSAIDSIVFSMKSNKVYMYENGQVLYQNIELNSAFIEFSLDSTIVYATGATDSTGAVYGKPIYKEGTDEYHANELRYNFSTKRGIVKGVFTKQEEGYLHSELTKMHSDGSVHLLHGKYTTCDLEENPHFYFALTKAIVIPKDKIISGPLYFVLADVPTPIALPFAFFPNKGKQTSGILTPSFGEDNLKGFYLRDFGYYLRINDLWDLALTSDIYSNGSWEAQAVMSYMVKYKFRGGFDISYANNITGDKNDIDYTPSSNFWVRWNHSQDPKARPNVTFSANVDFGTSNFHQNNSTNYTQALKNEFGSSISYSKRWAYLPINFTSSLSHRQNTQSKMISLTAPQLAFNMNRIYPFQTERYTGQRFVDKIFGKISVGYSADLKNVVSEADSILFTNEAEWKNGFHHEVPISANYNFLKFFSLSPSVTYNGNVYTSRITKNWDSQLNYDELTNQYSGGVNADTLTGFSYAHAINPSISFGVNPRFFGMYQFTRENRKVEAIRHVMAPAASISFSPEFSSTKDRYNNVYYDENNDKEVEYSIYENGIYSTPSPSRRSGSINLSLNNNIEMKLKSKSDTTEEFRKISLIDKLNFGASYNIFKDSLNWSDVSVNSSTKLFNIFDITASASFSLYDVDTSGTVINSFLYKQGGAPLRMNYFNTSVRFGLSPGLFTAVEFTNPFAMPYLWEDYYRYSYVDFSLPWTLNFQYDFKINNKFSKVTKTFEPVIEQTCKIDGNINLTEKWGFRFSTGYDIENKQISSTSMGITRDLHCWQMELSWIPFGKYQSYNFIIHIKSSTLKDVKWKRNKSWTED